MILACPSCPARYEMADGALGANGRKVRCAACGHSWLAGPDGSPKEEVAASAAVAPPEPQGPTRADVERARRAEARPHDQMRARIQASNKKAANAAATRAYISAGILVAGALGVCVAFRQTIVEAWPKAASAYAMAGLKVNAYGLDYFNVKASRSYQGETPVLKVRGEVRNVGKRARAAPDVRIAIRDKKGKELHSWKTQVDALIIGPGEAAPFASYIANPPAGGYDVSISFALETSSAPRKSSPPHAEGTAHPAPASPAALEAVGHGAEAAGDLSPDGAATSGAPAADPHADAHDGRHG